MKPKASELWAFVPVLGFIGVLIIVRVDPAIIVSAIAVLIAAANSYVQFFRKFDELSATPLNFSASCKTIVQKGNVLTIDVSIAFANTGTNPVIVAAVTALLCYPHSNSRHSLGRWMDPQNGKELQPTLIRPGGLKVAPARYELTGKSTVLTEDGTYEVPLRFELVDSKGNSKGIEVSQFTLSAENGEIRSHHSIHKKVSLIPGAERRSDASTTILMKGVAAEGGRRPDPETD